ncbi:MAG: ligase-associated DNA damage response endonuclease PdeM [Pseudomonadota bacterium]
MAGSPALSGTDGARPTCITLSGHELTLLPEGALWWDAEATLVVSDLHLEKGSSYASKGQLLPPYDTSATLRQVEALVAAWNPKRIISLGDSFHDGEAEARLSSGDRARIKALTAGAEWFWVEGNHDPDPPESLGGAGARELCLGNLVFRHEPQGDAGEIAGHLHPAAKVRARGRAVRRRCFATNGRSLIMPALGAYTGGLNVCDPAFFELFESVPSAYVLGEDRVFPLASKRLEPDNQRPDGLWSL